MCLILLATSAYLSSKHVHNVYSLAAVKPLHTTTLDVSKLEEGTYEIDVTGEEEEKTVRVVVK